MMRMMVVMQEISQDGGKREEGRNIPSVFNQCTKVGINKISGTDKHSTL